MNKLLATIFLEACTIREQSYDKEGADKASEGAQKEREADPSNLYAGLVDYATFYRKTMGQAADEAALKYGEPKLGEVIYYLMTYVWNDMHDWAEEQKKDSAKKALPAHLMEATEAAWAQRAKVQGLPSPSTKTHKKAEAEFFIGAMLAFDAVGYVISPRWTINIMQNKNVGAK